MLEEKHGITVEEAEKTLSDWVTSIGKQTVVDMKSDVYYIPDNINETGELSLFYEDKKKLENGEGCLIDIPECYINLLGDGIYSASDGDRTTMRDVERITVFLGRTEKFFDLFRVTFCYGVSGFLQCIDIGID